MKGGENDEISNTATIVSNSLSGNKGL